MKVKDYQRLVNAIAKGNHVLTDAQKASHRLINDADVARRRLDAQKVADSEVK